MIDRTINSRGDAMLAVCVVILLVSLPWIKRQGFDQPSSGAHPQDIATMIPSTRVYPLLQGPPPFAVLNPDDYRSYFPNEQSFQVAKSTAPFLDLPRQEPYGDALTAFYYRIRSYRQHISRTKDDRYWIVTEFTPRVPWAGPSNTISAAAGHHIREGRWFWDAIHFVDNYIRFWYLGGDDNIFQPHIATYTNWIYHACLQYALLWGIHQPQVNSLLRDTLPQAIDVFRNVYVDKYLTNSSRNSPVWNATRRICWRQDDGYDAMEVSVSGGGCRPTIAAAMWGEAQAIVDAATVLLLKNGNYIASHIHLSEVIRDFSQWAVFSKQVITQQHWNPDIQSFSVIPPPETLPTKTGIRHSKLAKHFSFQQQQQQQQNCDLQAIRVPNRPVQGRELLAFMPWYYSSMLLNDTNATKWARQFQWLLDTKDGFAAPWGLRTVQRSTPCYNYSWEHGDCWNGPSWPYETSRVLTAVANLLSDADEETVLASGMNSTVFEGLFLQYARQHTRTYAENDTAFPLGSGHIFENLHPDLGYWNNRAIMYWHNDTNKDMGTDYNHSTFLDLVLASWLGIRLSTAESWLTLHPLIQAPYFAVDRVPYKGRVLSIVYDPSGTRYTASGVKLQGLAILLEGNVVASRPDLGSITIEREPVL